MTPDRRSPRRCQTSAGTPPKRGGERRGKPRPDTAGDPPGLGPLVGQGRGGQEWGGQGREERPGEARRGQGTAAPGLPPEEKFGEDVRLLQGGPLHGARWAAPCRDRRPPIAHAWLARSAPLPGLSHLIRSGRSDVIACLLPLPLSPPLLCPGSKAGGLGSRPALCLLLPPPPLSSPPRPAPTRAGSPSFPQAPRDPSADSRHPLPGALQPAPAPKPPPEIPRWAPAAGRGQVGSRERCRPLRDTRAAMVFFRFSCRHSYSKLGGWEKRIPPGLSLKTRVQPGFCSAVCALCKQQPGSQGQHDGKHA